MIDEREQSGHLKRNLSYVKGGLADSQPSRALTGSENYPHKTTIVFFGSGPVAAVSLQRLARNFDIEAVVTKPKPPHHHGEFPVLSVASQLSLNTRTVVDKAELSALVASHPFRSRLGILVDFGIIVSQDVIDYFPFGIANSHFSLLPKWRGADPITFSILSGDARTGVSLMLLVEKMDAGPLLGQKKLLMTLDETSYTLTNNLIELSDELMAELLPAYIAGQLNSYEQDKDVTPTYSRKLTKVDGIIDWTKPAEQLEREIRAFHDWPKSRTTLGKKEIIITEATVADLRGKPGQILEKHNRLVIACGQDCLEIIKLKPAGKKEMSAKAFLAGYSRLL